MPIGEDKLPEVLALQRDHSGAQLHVFVDTLTAAEYTNRAAAAAGRRQTVFLKIDCGYGCGTTDGPDGIGGMDGMVPDCPPFLAGGAYGGTLQARRRPGA